MQFTKTFLTCAAGAGLTFAVAGQADDALDAVRSSAPPAAPEVVNVAEAPAAEIKQRPRVQIAILLDNSGSMSGLINQARGELWKVVNDLALAKRGGQRPDLRVALYTYGDPPPKRLVALTDDLDKVSEALFKVGISGGSEYCGQVIQTAVNDLAWSGSADDLKMIFIAGNEPFSQGPVDYRAACRAAIAKGITVNTIHCGPSMPDGWRQGALLADGRSLNIDHNQAVAQIEAPQDSEIMRLNDELNKTYIPFGDRGKIGAARQVAQDHNASSLSVSSAASRVASKVSVYYRNSTWDLVDARRDKDFDWSKIKDADLPENMRNMSAQEREAHVQSFQKKRDALRKQIAELNQARKSFVAEKLKERGADSLDTALIKSIRLQAVKKQYVFESENK